MRVGLLGGTFNPMHAGHVRLAVEALEGLGLDRVEIMPVGQHPFKPVAGLLPFPLRVDLCRAAVDGVSGLALNPVEGERSGPSYTIETLRRLTASRPEDEFSFILGMGEFLMLHEWREGLRLSEYAHLVVAARAGAAAAAGRLAGPDRARQYAGEHWPGSAPAGPGRWTLPTGRTLAFLDVPRLDISASDIRGRFLAGRCLAGLVPSGVERLLVSHAPAVRAAWEAAGEGGALSGLPPQP